MPGEFNPVSKGEPEKTWTPVESNQLKTPKPVAVKGSIELFPQELTVLAKGAGGVFVIIKLKHL